MTAGSAIAAADESDDWTDPQFRRREPSWGISVKVDDLARRPRKQPPCRAPERLQRMHLNVWTEQAERWIDIAAWDGCNGLVDLETLRGRPCFGGLDLSTTTDVTALAWVFPSRGRRWPMAPAVPVFCARGEPAQARRARPGALRSLDRQAFIEATPGNVVDYGAIEQKILATVPVLRSRKSPTTPGTRPISRSACRTKAPPWSSSARASAPWPPRPASSRSPIRPPQARAWRQPGHPLDGRQRRRHPGSRWQSEARQG